MTEEQIKKDAERYASVNYHPYDSENNPQYLIVSKDSFIAGAHSRDEEIFKLQEKVEAMQSYIEEEKNCMQDEIEELSEQLKMNAENIQKLHNP